VLPLSAARRIATGEWRFRGLITSFMPAFSGFWFSCESMACLSRPERIDNPGIEK
jgi:hypothetical protein